MSALLLRNGTLIDGSGAKARSADILIEGDRIAGVAASLRCNPGVTVVDLAGRTVAPGFVDIHAHGELEPLVDNRAAGKVLSGVTTEISGNCGHSPFPLFGELRPRFEREALNDWALPGALPWTTAAEYFEVLEEKRCTINRGFLLGHGSLRAAVNGYSDSALGCEGKARMVRETEAALDAGCFGLSTGLVYPPGCFASPEEIADLAGVCARKGALYTTHMRSEGDGLEEAIGETLEVCRRSGARTQISHLKTAQQRNWHKLDAVERMLFAARREGIDFHADRYPYVAGATSLDTILPAWAYAGGNAQELERLRDNEIFARLEAEVLALNPAPDYFDSIRISSVGHSGLRDEIAGRSLAEIAAGWKVRPFEAFRRIAIEDELRTGAVFFMMCEENLERILSWEFVMLASDATARAIDGPTAQAAPHPRTFGTFPRALAKYARERGLLSVEETVRRMTSLPAEAFHIERRGRVSPGYFADLVIFDPTTIQDRATFEAPNQFPDGISSVFVNGVQVVEAGRILEARPGRVLRRG